MPFVKLILWQGKRKIYLKISDNYLLKQEVKDMNQKFSQKSQLFIKEIGNSSLRVINFYSSYATKAVTKQVGPKICLSCTQNGVFFSAASCSF